MNLSGHDFYDHEEWGHCNSCGEEAPLYGECCEDGEIVPDEE